MPQQRTIPSNPLEASVVTYTIKIDEQMVSRAYGVKSIVINKQVNKIPKLLLTIIDGNAATEDFEISNQAYFIPGKNISITAGYNSQEQLLFSGIIIKHSIKISNQESLLLVEAADKAFKMALNPQRKIFNNVSDSDVIERIASENEIEVSIEPSSFIHIELMQYYATDWDYIQTRAEASGMLCFCDNGLLTVKTPDFTEQPSLNLTYGATIKNFNAEIDTRYQYSGIEGISWSSADQQIINVSANPTDLDNNGNLSSSDLSAVSQSGAIAYIHGGNVKEPMLQKKVDLQLLKSRLAKIRGTVTCSGFNPIKPGDMLGLNGVGERFNGNSFVSAVHHEISNGVWDTTIQFGLSHKWFAQENDIQPIPASGLTPSINGLQIGVVTQLENDPEGEDRIKVKLPVVDNNSDGTWCKIALPDAGNNRGFFFMPEIGDEVVVGFLNEDPDHAIILGGLHSSSKPAPIKASDENNEKGIVTRSQMKWLWNDDKKELNIETPAGNKMMISDDAGEINLQDQHGNKIIMNSDGVSIESTKDIILKAAQNIVINAEINTEINAGASLKANSSAGSELTSNGTTIIKGSMVMIN